MWAWEKARMKLQGLWRLTFLKHSHVKSASKIKELISSDFCFYWWSYASFLFSTFCPKKVLLKKKAFDMKLNAALKIAMLKLLWLPSDVNPFMVKCVFVSFTSKFDILLGFNFAVNGRRRLRDGENLRNFNQTYVGNFRGIWEACGNFVEFSFLIKLSEVLFIYFTTVISTQSLDKFALTPPVQCHQTC